jgi:tRNA (cytidine/uridine-2'-O-)-methyltransferase
VIHLVLFEPEIPPNTGNAIRLCANVGATLHLVKPLGFRLDDRSLQRSGLDYHDLADVRVHTDLDACLLTLTDSRVFAVETGAQIRYSDHDYRAGDAFVFGSETRGLSAAIQDRLGREHALYLPMRHGSRSINLSNTVAIIAFEAWRRLGFAGCGAGCGAG